MGLLPTLATAGPTIRRFAFVGGCTVAMVSASGLLTPVLFSQPSLSKYAVTVLAPAILAVLAMARMPLRFIVGLSILVAPLAFVATFSGIQITLLQCLLVAAAVLAAAGVRTERMGWLGYGSIAASVALVPAIASASNVASYTLWLVETLFMGWLVYVVAREPGGGRFVCVMIIGSAALQGLLAVYEYRSGHQLNLYNQSGTTTLGSGYFFSYGSAKRYTGAMPDPIALGNVLAMGIPLIVCLAALERRAWIRLLIAILGAGTTLGLVLSLSRMSWIGAASGVITCLLLLPKRVRLPSVIGVVATAAVVGAVGLGLGGASLRKRISSTLNPTNLQSTYSITAQGDQLRIRLWSAAIRTAEAKPLTGSGFGNLVPDLDRHGVSVPLGAHAQSWYFQLLGEAGLFGGVALLCWIIAALRDLWVAFGRFRIIVSGAAGSLVAILITWTTDIEPRYVQVSAMVASLFGLIAALGARTPPAGTDVAST